MDSNATATEASRGRQHDRSQIANDDCVVESIGNRLTPMDALKRLADMPGCLMMESSMRHSQLGRYSFVTADPFEWMSCARAGQEEFDWLNRHTSHSLARPLADGPPFQGGVAGLFSYDLCQAIEPIPIAQHSDFPTPMMALGAYDVVLAWDHVASSAILISTGMPETNSDKRRQRARRRADEFLRKLENAPVATGAPPQKQHSINAPQTVVNGKLTTNLSKERYVETIGAALDYIYAGDIYQVNLAQQLLHPATLHPLALYERLRSVNPSTFGGYFDLGPTQILSASPERFIAIRDDQIETRPIKGTRRRTRRPEVDWHLVDELTSSDKDRAENAMIVDLMRNDLSRICEDDSVRVTQFLKLEEYESVLHLVSAIKGKLTESISAEQILRAVFPGGSITGAPKIRAMQIISELEPSNRGAYCGCLGYFGWDGNIDLNILIRTITASDGWWQIPVGGGIVSQSKPEEEYEETWTKAAALLRAIDA